ncbi:MAG TPA: hypothetical protein VFJ13_09655 [Paracoccaceae bacterium]|nr:hypothetical protein [Paracoccaceae bacterium]
MKTMIAAVAVLLAAGTASAADVEVVVDPDAEDDIIVRQIDPTPAMDSGLVEPRPDEGMLSTDDLVDGEDAEAVFGFDPDAVIYIRPGEETGVRTFETD